jgi:hypothetical protein
MLILQESSGRMWAVPIDGILGIRLISDNPSQKDAPLLPHWLSGSFDDDSGVFHLLDNDNLFRQITLATA